MSTKRKLKEKPTIEDVADAGIDLFVDEPADEDDAGDSDSSDLTDSEDSVYSGLEEEEDSSDEEGSEEESEKLMNDSDDEEDDDEGDDDDDDDTTDSSNNEDIFDNFDINRQLIEKTSLMDRTSKKTQAVKKLKPRKTKQEQNEENDSKTLNGNKKKTLEKDEDVEETEVKVDEEPKEKKVDEYDQDSSDEEDIRNTVGNIPMEWYRNMKHIGYDIEGRKLIKPVQGDQLDDFLNKVDDPNYWRTVTNKMTGQNVILSDQDVSLIQNLQAKKHPTGSTDQYGPWMEFFTNEVMIHPLSNQPEHKRSFIPSKWERLKVGQMVHALKMGWMKFSKTEEEKEEEEEEDETEKFFMLWKDEDEPEINKRFRQHIPAPRLRLPGHEESYNPPPEYLFTKEEEEKWKNTEPEDRRIKFIPQKFSNLRSVPAFPRLINERFERCLDLYLCPRQKIMRMNVDPEDLIPKLPKPKDLQPFPTTESLVYRGHGDLVRCVSLDPSGQWLVSGSDDQSVKVWEVSTGRCMKTFSVGGVVSSLEWNPNPAVCLVAIAVGKTVVLLNPGVGDKLQVSNTDTMLKAYQQDDDTDLNPQATWSDYDSKEYDQGFRLKLQHSFEVKQVTWHGKGDYFASVMPQGNNRSVLIHQLSRRRSQNPFSKSKGLIQCVRFHPIRPFLFVATQRYVRIYNLLKQELSKKLMTNCKWVSSMAIHPEGDNVIIGSYDCRVSWFDLDLSTKPYQTLRNHKRAVRQVAYHKRYPLFASASDDCSIIVSHGMVYNDLLQNPLIVPVKILRGHAAQKDVGILDCVFHPSQPWIFSAGADGTIRLYT